MIPIRDRDIRAAVGILPKSWANRFRDYTMDPIEGKERKQLAELFEMLRIAAIITAVGAVIVFAVFPSFHTGWLMAFSGYVSYEIFVVAANVQRIFDDFTLEARCGKNEKTGLKEILKGTLLAHHVVPLIWRPRI